MKKRSSNELVVFQSSDQEVVFQVVLDGENDTVWLTQIQMAELFNSSRVNVAEHINNVFSGGELNRKATSRNFQLVRKKGKREVTRSIEHYNLNEQKQLKINENTLVALALAVAQSLPEQRALIVKLIINLIRNEVC